MCISGFLIVWAPDVGQAFQSAVRSRPPVFPGLKIERKPGYPEYVADSGQSVLNPRICHLQAQGGYFALELACFAQEQRLLLLDGFEKSPAIGGLGDIDRRGAAGLLPPPAAPDSCQANPASKIARKTITDAVFTGIIGPTRFF